MAVINPLREVTAENTNQLTFTPPSGRAAIVFDIGVVTDNNGFVTIKSANSTVGFFEIGWYAHNHLHLAPGNEFAKSVFQYLKEIGLPTEFPIPEGEKFVLTSTVTTKYMVVRYREVEPSDITPDMPNAKAAKEMLRVFYGTNKEDITSSGWYRLDKSLNPAEMHNWPYEEVASPFDVVELHAIGVLDVQHTEAGTTTDHAETKRVRLWKGTEVLIHPNEDGFICVGDRAPEGAAGTSYGLGINELVYATPTTGTKLFTFPEPIRFSKGEEMAIEIYVNVEGSGAKMPANTLRAALFCKVIRGE